jgi:hypothetical protein
VKVSNRLNFPQALVDAVTNDGYSKGNADFSITELLSPPRQSALRRQHENDIEEDASERIWSLYGQLVHKLLERANRASHVEARLFMEINGIRISGQIDSFEIKDGEMTDWKFVSAYKFKDGLPLEYEQQQNCYVELARANSIDVKRSNIVGLLRDHSKLEAKREASYPQLPVIRVEVPIWEREKVIAFLKERIALHVAARTTLPQCSEEDRWARPTKYAVMKKGAARATKLYDTKEAAETHAATSKDFFVEHRPGENVRCESYCPVAKFCTQFQALKAAEGQKRLAKPPSKSEGDDQ